MRSKYFLQYFLILFVAGLSYIISNTYFRFNSEGINVAKVSAAKWEILINDKSINEQFKFNLFEIISNNNESNIPILYCLEEDGKYEE